MNNSTAGNALVTGVSGSFGNEIAKHLVSKSYRVLGLDIRQNEDAVLAQSDRFEFKQCDLTRYDELERAIDDFSKSIGAFDVVINNAGVLYNEPLMSFKNGKLVPHDIEKWDEIIRICLSAPFYVIACTAKNMVERRRKAVIINISSISANGNVGQAAYSAAKAGLNGLTKALSKELGPVGIRVVAIAPGFFDTKSTRSVLSGEQLSDIKKRVPLKQLGGTQNLLTAIDFVIANAYFNGKILELDGGLTI
jgi:3-oxoacyl-[acyl-carrier protein] reductase